MEERCKLYCLIAKKINKAFGSEIFFRTSLSHKDVLTLPLYDIFSFISKKDEFKDFFLSYVWPN